MYICLSPRLHPSRDPCRLLLEFTSARCLAPKLGPPLHCSLLNSALISTALHFPLQHCTDLLHSTILYGTALHCTDLLHSTVLYGTALHCSTTLHCSLLHCTALYCSTALHCIALHCSLLHYTALHGN